MSTVENITGDSTSNGRDLLKEHEGDFDNPHNVQHDQLPDVTPDQHHPQFHDLDSHTDVTAPAPNPGESLTWDGTAWVNQALSYESTPTGLVNGGELNIGPGVNDIEVLAGDGVVIDSYTDPLAPPVVTRVSWPQINEAITAAPAVAGSVVWFTIQPDPLSAVGPLADSVLGTLQQYNTPPNEPLRRDEIFLGVSLHNGDEWGEISAPNVVNNSAHTLIEFVRRVVGPTFVVDGGEVTEGAGFTLDQAAGTVWELNRNWHVDKKNPHREALPQTTGLQVRYVNRDFTDVSALTGVVDPTQWDDNGTVSAIPGAGNNATVQQLYQDPRDNYWILWGQEIYDNATEAAASLNAPTVIPPILGASVLLGYIVVEKGKNDWDIDEAFLVYPQGSGGVGGGGVPITDHSDLTNIQPDDHHAQVHNLYSTDHADIDTIPALAPAHVLHREVGNLNWEVDYRAKFLPFVNGQTYYPQQTVFEAGWLTVANTETTDYPAPTAIGVAFDVYTGAAPTSQTTAKQVIFGTRYSPTISFWSDKIRVYTVTGNEYTVFSVLDPLGGPIFNEIISFTAEETGWADIERPTALILAGQVFDVVAVVQEPDPTPTTFNGNWDYDTPNNPGVPGAGVIVHANQAQSEFRISKTDNDAGDRSAELAGLEVGDIIDWGNGGTRWAIQSIQDNGTWFNFGVAPASQESPDGVRNFTFETVTATPITRMIDANWWLNEGITPAVQGLYVEDDSYDNIAVNDNAYGIDLFIQEATISPDWDIYGSPGGGGSGGGGSFVPDLFTGAGTSGYVPDPVTETGSFLRDDGTWQTAGGSTEALIPQTAHGFVVQDCVRFNGTGWVKAVADDPNTTALGLVVQVPDVDSFRLAMSGRFAITHGLTPDEWHYLSDATPGLLTAVEPAISQPIVYTEDANHLFIFPYRPSLKTTPDSPMIGEIRGYYEEPVSLNFGWHICDGTNGTPDLRGRVPIAEDGGDFIFGLTGGSIPAGDTETGSAGDHDHGFTTGNAGGHSHTLSVNIGGGHSHTLQIDFAGSHTHGASAGAPSVSVAVASGSGQTPAGGGHGHAITVNSDGSHSHSGNTFTDSGHSHGGTASAVGDHAHTGTVDSGGAHTHSVEPNDLPPYHVIKGWIMYTGVA